MTRSGNQDTLPSNARNADSKRLDYRQHPLSPSRAIPPPTATPERTNTVDDEHASHCSVWTWTASERVLNNAKPCTCGFRDREAKLQAQELTRHRPLRPLSMSE